MVVIAMTYGTYSRDKPVMTAELVYVLTYSYSFNYWLVVIRVVAPFSTVTRPRACSPEQSHWFDMRLTGVRECFHFESAVMLAWTRTRMSCSIYILFCCCGIQWRSCYTGIYERVHDWRWCDVRCRHNCSAPDIRSSIKNMEFNNRKKCYIVRVACFPGHQYAMRAQATCLVYNPGCRTSRSSRNNYVAKPWTIVFAECATVTRDLERDTLNSALRASKPLRY